MKHTLLNGYKNTIFYRYIGSAIAHPKKFFFCLRYPFYKARNVWTDKFLGYAFVEYEWIELGGRLAFGKQLSKELKSALKKDHILKTFRFTEIKEKGGTLCLYNNGTGRNSEFVIDKYELMSQCYCIHCGKPVRYITKGGVSYICEDCARKELSKEALKDCKVRLKDLPNWSDYDTKKNKFVLIDLKKKYGIDVKEIGGLKHD